LANEEGVVIRADASGTWVKTIRSDACESCASHGACHSLGGGKEMEVSAVNRIGARVGDRVVLKMDTLSFLKGTFLVYLFPILLLVVGAALGEWISLSSNLQSPLPSILSGFCGLALGLVLMKMIANRLAKRDDYRPRIARVVGRASGGSTRGDGDPPSITETTSADRVRSG
jgi:sigma-E factor negative regulatory protein RseC